MTKLKIKHYQDPGHGWLAVKIDLIRKLGIMGKVSLYSYVKGQTAYLEEDCDASVFLEAAKAAGYDVEIIRKNTNKSSPIRSYSCFR
jgi:hypothetical protein